MMGSVIASHSPRSMRTSPTWVGLRPRVTTMIGLASEVITLPAMLLGASETLYATNSPRGTSGCSDFGADGSDAGAV